MRANDHQKFVPKIKPLSDYSKVPEKGTAAYADYLNSLIKDVYDRADEVQYNWQIPHPQPKDLPPIPGS
jgi:hypothetical protein